MKVIKTGITSISPDLLKPGDVYTFGNEASYRLCARDYVDDKAVDLSICLQSGLAMEMPTKWVRLIKGEFREEGAE